ncbi:MAG TPA: hypothetical protein VMV52_03195 [Candidatus Nanopelagicaceae bacterium]|nr:hypothetical protein [Candidatus Nanopelagicaceae bacterium]
MRIGRVVALTLAPGLLLGPSLANAATPATVKATIQIPIALLSASEDIAQIIPSGSSWLIVGNMDQTTIDSSPLLPTEPTKGESDGYVSMLDSKLALVWTHRFGTSHDDVATAIARDSAGVIWSVGVTTKERQPTPATSATTPATSASPTVAPATPSATSPADPMATLNPDGVVPVTLPAAAPIGDQLLIASFDAKGQLLSQNLVTIADGVALNPSALVPAKSGVYVVGTALNPETAASRGFYALIGADGTLGSVHWVGAKAVVLRSAALLGNGALALAGSIAERLKGRRAIGATDALIEVVNPDSGALLRAQRSGNTGAVRAWGSLVADRHGNLYATGLSLAGKTSEAVLTSFAPSLAVRYSLRLPSPLGQPLVLAAPRGASVAIALSNVRKTRRGIETYLLPVSGTGRALAPTYLLGKSAVGLLAAASGKGYLLANGTATGVTLSWFAPRSKK